LQKLDRNTKIHFAYMLKKFRTAAALDFMWYPNSLILVWPLLDSIKKNIFSMEM
jgi:hypothetical protein